MLQKRIPIINKSIAELVDLGQKFAEKIYSSPAPTDNQALTLKALQTHLQQRIAAICGKSSKDIEVTALTEKTVTVRVRAHSTLEGEELGNRIFQIPELGPYQVSLDVLVLK